MQPRHDPVRVDHARQQHRAAIRVRDGRGASEDLSPAIGQRQREVPGRQSHLGGDGERSARRRLAGGPAACGECHTEEMKKRSSGSHKRVSCEVCHAPLAVHATADDVIAEMPIHRDAELCLNCHRRLEARPVSHPQIRERDHLKDQGVEEATPDVCFDCHSPHSPL